MRMLEVGDHLSLGLESADELRTIGELWSNLLDGHFTIDGGLESPKDNGERTLAYSLMQFIPSEPLGLETDQSRVVGQNLCFERLKLGTGFQTDFGGQPTPVILVFAKSLGRSTDLM